VTAQPQAEYWSQIARHWALLGPPLKPSAQDIEAYLRGVREFAAPSAAILGVTPELVAMPWPGGSKIVAIDHNPDMIRAVWPSGSRQAINGDWARLHVRDGTFDTILCDGGFSVVSFPDGGRRVAQSIGRALVPGGVALIRIYAPPTRKEDPEVILNDFVGGKVPTLNHLKLRLAMALESEPGAGVELSIIWQAIHKRAPDLHLLAAQLGWDPDHLLAINAYRDSRTCYYFPSIRSVHDLFDAHAFRFEWFSVPTYALGDRCQVHCWRKVSP
jgi:SAM-dependent methyltransferase